jgi:hypothetical protein
VIVMFRKLCCRSRVGALLTEQLAAASMPAKGGFVREALISSFPRLATLLDDLFEKLRHDTEVTSNRTLSLSLPVMSILPVISMSRVLACDIYLSLSLPKTG